MSNAENSQFGAASQWFYNWIPNDSTISIQKEGSTEQCLSCVSEGTFTIYSFDDPQLNPSGKLMGLHIPIGVYVDDYARTFIYSYWLSYRGVSLDGAAEHGVSAHLVWFILDEAYDTGIGAVFDSMSFDAFGDTITTRDSFVLPETCYVLSTTSFLKDKYDVSDIMQVQQPVVCVDSIVDGESATVTVTFLDESNSLSVQADANIEQFQCAEFNKDTTLSFDSSKSTLIHVSGIAEDGSLNLSVCPDGESVEVGVYMYDS